MSSWPRGVQVSVSNLSKSSYGVQEAPWACELGKTDGVDWAVSGPWRRQVALVGSSTGGGTLTTGLVWGVSHRSGVTGCLAACCSRSVFTSCRISFISSFNSSIRLFTPSRRSSIRRLTLASLAFSSYQMRPRKAVKKPDGNHSVRPGGSVGMAQVVRGTCSGYLDGRGTRVRLKT